MYSTSYLYDFDTFNSWINSNKSFIPSIYYSLIYVTSFSAYFNGAKDVVRSYFLFFKIDLLAKGKTNNYSLAFGRYFLANILVRLDDFLRLTFSTE